MQHASEILKNTIEQLDKQSLSTIDNCTIVPNKQIDTILVEKRHLICDEFKGWYCKWIRQYGVDAFYKLASQAEQEGKNKPRYFSWLLKNYS